MTDLLQKEYDNFVTDLPYSTYQNCQNLTLSWAEICVDLLYYCALRGSFLAQCLSVLARFTASDAMSFGAETISKLSSVLLLGLWCCPTRLQVSYKDRFLGLTASPVYSAALPSEKLKFHVNCKCWRLTIKKCHDAAELLLEYGNMFKAIYFTKAQQW